MFEAKDYSNDHLPPTVMSGGHELFIDVKGDLSMHFHARYYSSTVFETGISMDTLWLIEAERRIYASVNYTIIGSDNGLSPGRRQAIIWTNAGILLIWPLGTNFSEVLIAIHTFLSKKMHLKMSSVKWRPFCLGLNVLTSKGSPLGDSRGINHLQRGCLCKHTECTHNEAHLTHGSRDEIDTVLQTTLSNAFSWLKMYWFRLKIHWSLFPGFQLTISQHWFI